MRIPSAFFLLFIACSSVSLAEHSGSSVVTKIEPAFWWVNMKDLNLQIMLYGKNIATSSISIEYKGVTVKNQIKTSNPNYLFLYLYIDRNTATGKMPIKFKKDGKESIVYYELKQRKGIKHQPLDASDAIYLITPDRFANGNPSNDDQPGMLEKSNPNSDDGRHGGDLRGIINQLDYIKKMGFNTIWLNPVMENNRSVISYHGYGITDFYKVDARYGNNEEYVELVDKLHQKDMKIILDQVFNHCGDNHWWCKDLPSKDWLNDSTLYPRSNFINTVVSDPYRSVYDVNKHSRGWFDYSLPDLNLDNSLLADYMIQNSIWWIEYGGFDAIRVDTYPYSSRAAIKKWEIRMKQEYPNMYILPENWLGKVSFEAYWTQKIDSRGDFPTTNLYGVTDFPLYMTIAKAFTPDGNLFSLYETLSEDFLYSAPMHHVIFLDNHDMDRFYAVCGPDKNLFKLAIAFLATTRGIPQWYYGSEILLSGTKPDGIIRSDMPGGFANSDKNAFTGKNLNSEEKDMQAYVEKLFNWRKTNTAITKGSLMHFIPEKNVYVYFRQSDSQTVMVVLNKSKQAVTLDKKRFEEALYPYTVAKDIISGNNFDLKLPITINVETALIAELN